MQELEFTLDKEFIELNKLLKIMALVDWTTKRDKYKTSTIQAIT